MHNRRRFPSILLALALAAAACGGSGDTPPPDAAAEAEEEVVDTEETPSPTAEETPPAIETDEPDEAATTPDEEPEGEASSERGDEMPEPGFQSVLRGDFEFGFIWERAQIQETLDQYAPVLLQAGTYTTDSMRTPMTFTTDRRWRLIIEQPSFLVLVEHEEAQGLWDLPLIQFNRPQAMIDPTDTTEGPPRFPRTVEGFDYDAWFAAHPQLDVERSEVVVGGIPSLRYDIVHADGIEIGWTCGPSVQCTPLNMLFDAGPQDLQSNELFSFWVVPQGDGSPLTALAVADATKGWGDFLGITEDLMTSIEFGDIVEPVFSERPWEDGISGLIPAGPVWFPIAGGVAFELPEEVFARQRRNWSLLDMEDVDFRFFPPNVEIALAAEGRDGTPIETADQLVDLLVDQAGGVRVEDGELLGRRAARVQMFGVRPDALMFRHVDTPDGIDPGLTGWYTLDYVELWATETPAGVLIVTAEAESEELLVEALRLHESIRSTLVLEPR